MQEVIDTHTHFLPETFLRKAQADPDRYHVDVTERSDGYYLKTRFWSLSRFMEYGPFRKEHYDWDARVAYMDQAGISCQVVSTVQSLNYAWAPTELALEVAQIANDEMARAAALYPGRFQGIASVPMQDAATAVEEMKRATNELGLRGVQLLSNVNGTNLDDAELEPLFDYLDENALPIFIHPYGDLNPERFRKKFLVNIVGWPTELALAISGLILDGLLDRHPRIRFHLGHGGGTFLFVIGRMRRALNAVEDLHGVLEHDVEDYLSHIYVDTLLHDSRAIRYALEVLGPNRVILGTDWPFWMQDPKMLERMNSIEGVEKSTLDRVLNWNAVELYRL
jgi:aminocarboxymuconate-semialdehyde decarboxylase